MKRFTIFEELNPKQKEYVNQMVGHTPTSDNDEPFPHPRLAFSDHVFGPHDSKNRSDHVKVIPIEHPNTPLAPHPDVSRHFVDHYFKTNQVCNVFMEAAESFSRLSSARRRKVGCVVVKDGNIIGVGYNGTPSGWDNNCELEHPDGTLETKKEVIHAETNAIAKVARSTNSCDGAIMFLTDSPCFECAKLIIQSGISEVYYKNIYRDSTGVDFLKRASIICEQI